jgi:energy-coupling factor transporter transmembrane protein EcfT
VTAPEPRSVLGSGVLLALAVVVAPGGKVLAISAGFAAAAGLALSHSARAGLPGPREWRAWIGLCVFAWILNALFAPGRHWVAGGRTWPVTLEGIRLGGETALRLLSLGLLARGASRAMSSLDALGLYERLAGFLPRRWADALGVIVLVALRLGPDLADESRRLNAQRALRGGWPGPTAPWAERRKRLALGLRDLPEVVVPLTLLSLRRADQLSWALPARYYGLATRTPADSAPWKAREWAWVTGGLAVLAGSIWARWA